MKIMPIFGTRPEAIKMAPVIKAIAQKPDCFELSVCITAQHREMLDQVLDLFELSPDIDLNLMKPGQSLTELTTRALQSLQEALSTEKPDLILVHGDTTTTFTASLAAFYQQIPIAHVEAGLRTNNINAPWPEEFNRRATSLVTKYHFAPTKRARQNLIEEKIEPNNILVTGNTVIDALNWVTGKINRDTTISGQLDKQFDFLSTDRKLLLVTGHRRENFGQGFINVCQALQSLAERDDMEIIYPVHLNPNVKGPVTELLGQIKNVHLIPPQDYLPFVYLMSRAHIILTDSGGVQEEAPSLGKPVIVMRDTTERPEAVEAGTVKLAGTDKGRITSTVNELMDDDATYQKMSIAHNPYGDGKACERIVKFLEEKR